MTATFLLCTKHSLFKKHKSGIHLWRWTCWSKRVSIINRRLFSSLIQDLMVNSDWLFANFLQKLIVSAALDDLWLYGHLGTWTSSPCDINKVKQQHWHHAGEDLFSHWRGSVLTQITIRFLLKTWHGFMPINSFCHGACHTWLCQWKSPFYSLDTTFLKGVVFKLKKKTSIKHSFKWPC